MLRNLRFPTEKIQEMTSEQILYRDTIESVQAPNVKTEKRRSGEAVSAVRRNLQLSEWHLGLTTPMEISESPQSAR